MILRRPLAAGIAALLCLHQPAMAQEETPQCSLELVVLGAGQDAGAPQIGNADDDGVRLLPSSLGLIDRLENKRYIFDATPAITEQLGMLDTISPPLEGLGVDGVFITHAHIGHYLGLAYFGREAAGAKDIPVFAMPRMAQFLRTNGPWSQLTELGNIEIVPLNPDGHLALSDQLGVDQHKVPHRDEFSETVAFIITAGDKKILYAPDFDGWPDFDSFANGTDETLKYAQMLELMPQLSEVDYAFIDATFWDDNELGGRDMSEIPHPRVTETMALFQDRPADERAKIHFIHYNHTNPIRNPQSAQSAEVLKRGYNIARRGDRLCLR